MTDISDIVGIQISLSLSSSWQKKSLFYRLSPPGNFEGKEIIFLPPLDTHTGFQVAVFFLSLALKCITNQSINTTKNKI
jgi:hypothetical protein